jgi:hypothetical protein
MSIQPKEDRLTELLRQGDPLGKDSGLSPEQKVQMRREALSQVPETSSRRWFQLSPALSVAMLLAIALAVAWWPSSSPETRPLSLPTGEATVTQNPPDAGPGIQKSGNALENRKIQFETPGGTLVVWVLNPNFPS